jgi:anti-anti-sigma factor
MEITLQQLADGVVLALDGSLDYESAEEVERALDAAVEPCVSRLVLDMEKVEYLNSAGVRVLLSAYKTMREKDCRFEIVHARPLVREVLVVVGLDHVLPLADDAGGQ